MITPDDQALLVRAEAIACSLLSDIARDQGHPDQVVAPQIQAVTGVGGRTAGWAHTVTGGVPLPGTSGPDHAKARAIDAMAPGAMAVWAGGGVGGTCLFGDLLARAMQVRGVRGAVVDGGVRDTEELDRAGFPVHARYRTPQASTGHWRVHDSQVPVHLAGALGSLVTVHPGDLVVADPDGVVCIPREIVEDVLTAAEQHVRQEEDVRTRIDAGEDLEGLLRRYGRI